MISALEIVGLTHQYSKGGPYVLQNLSFRLEPGLVLGVLGASGSGKSTLLRCVAGFERPQQGLIRIGGATVQSETHFVPPALRNVGMVFQDFALFSHLTVKENLMLPLHAWSPKEKKKALDRWLDIVGLRGFEEARCSTLSGGQAQRVALARAMIVQPKLLLLDEPFSNLDTRLKEQLKLEMRALLKSQQATVILVTHDQHEAYDLADQVLVLKDGKNVQEGPPFEVYHKPQDAWVGRFLGRASFVTGQVQFNKGQWVVSTELGMLQGEVPNDLQAQGQAVSVLLRPDDLIHDDNSETRFPVVQRFFRGIYQIYVVKLPSGALVQCLAPSHHNHPLGEPMGVRLEVDHLVLFAES